MLIGICCGLLLVACGAAGLQDIEPCRSQTEIVVPSASEVDDAYRSAIIEGIEAIIAESLTFSGQHPERKLSNDSKFRADYVRYEQAGVCQAAMLVAIEPPSEYLVDFHTELSKTLSDYMAAMEFGHKAVKSRNVSDFRAWDGRENSAVERLTIAQDNIPTADSAP